MWYRIVYRRYCKCSNSHTDTLFKIPAVTWANKNMITNKHCRQSLNFNYNFQYRPEKDAYSMLTQLKRQQLADTKDNDYSCHQLSLQTAIKHDKECEETLPYKIYDEKTMHSDLPYKTLLYAPLPKKKASYCFRSFGPVPQHKKKWYRYTVLPAAIVLLLGLICLSTEEDEQH